MQRETDRVVDPWGVVPPVLTPTTQLSPMQCHVPPKESRTAAAARAASACPTATAWTMYSHLRFGEAHAPIGPGALPAAPSVYWYVKCSSSGERWIHNYFAGCEIWFCHFCSLAHILLIKASEYLDRDVRLSVWRANSLTATEYCCGDADTTQMNSSLACIDGDPTFTLPNATPILGVAGLSNAREASSKNSSSDTSGTATQTTSTAANRDDCASRRRDTITVRSVLGVSLAAVAVALIV